VGGPFVKNKLFYFASFEKQQYLIDCPVWPPNRQMTGLLWRKTS